MLNVCIIKYIGHFCTMARVAGEYEEMIELIHFYAMKDQVFILMIQ